MFKDPFPQHDDPNYGFNSIFLSNILHDWDQETSKKLCQKAFDALPSKGIILIHEALFNETFNEDAAGLQLLLCPSPTLTKLSGEIVVDEVGVIEPGGCGI